MAGECASDGRVERCGADTAALISRSGILWEENFSGRSFGRQFSKKLLPGNLVGAQQREMSRELLDVDPGGAARAQMIDEMKHAELRGVIDAVEHAFAGKHTGCAH